jgi:hypothetical protein
MIFLLLAAAYLVLVWIILRLIVPHLGFRRRPLPDTLPQDFEAMLHKLSIESSNNRDFLAKSYDYVTSHYKGSRIRTLANFWVAFQEPVNHPPGFLPCTSQNHLLRLMLVKSKRFQESDIEVKVIPLNLFIHQYLRVHVDGEWIDVDPWSAFRGIPLGKKSAFIG